MPYEISVILPCYNKEKTIMKTYNSIRRQTIFNKLEVIFIDDCSTDKTWFLLKKIRNESRFKNVFIYKNETNQGTYVSRKVGVRNSTGKYITFVDPDDTIEFTYYEELLKEMENNDCDMVVTRSVINIYDNGKRDKNTYCVPPVEDGIYDVIDNSKTKVFEGILFVWNRLYRPELFKYYLALPDCRVIYSEDYIINLIAIMSSKKIKYVTTKSNYLYDLTSENYHVNEDKNGDEKKKKDVSKSISTMWVLVEVYMYNANKLSFLPVLKQTRHSMFELVAEKYKKCFQREMFISKHTGEILQVIKPNERIKEREKYKIIMEIMKTGDL